MRIDVGPTALNNFSANFLATVYQKLRHLLLKRFNLFCYKAHLSPHLQSPADWAGPDAISQFKPLLFSPALSAAANAETGGSFARLPPPLSLFGSLIAIKKQKYGAPSFVLSQWFPFILLKYEWV